jgi:hypothetical protein
MEGHIPSEDISQIKAISQTSETILPPVDWDPNTKPDGKIGTTLYPHIGIALIEIAKVWAILGVMIIGALFAQHKFLDPQLDFFINLGCFLLVVGGALYAIYRILHYTNTYVEITKDALIYRKGWIPHSTDTIFWVHIKDINSSASVTESLLKTGSITILVAIRNSLVSTTISYLPKHDEFCIYIRERIGRFSDATRQVTYT